MKNLQLLVFLLVNAYSFSQIGIGTTTPNSSAVLDLTSTTKGFLPPRMSSAQKIAISSPATGLIVYCNNCGDNGEMQVYNGVAWINFSGAASATSVPNAPTSPIANAGNGQASVAFTETTFDGGSAITDYTVTSSPGGFTATGASTPILVTGLTNGTRYTFTVIATNAVGNSLASAASAAVVSCGAFVGAGDYKVFSCYNLGATDTTLDPNLPIQTIIGNYYQWGRSTIVATDSTSEALISGWNNTAAASTDWLDGSKTANDPCPSDYRVPTYTQWQNVINNNTASRTGTWTDSASNFTSALHFGPNVSTKTLTLPSVGCRSNTNGALSNRGIAGYYWSSTPNNSSSDAYYLDINDTNVSIGALNRAFGFSVRCVSE